MKHVYNVVEAWLAEMIPNPLRLICEVVQINGVSEV